MKSLSRRTYDIAAIVLAVIVFVALNIAADAWLDNRKARPDRQRPVHAGAGYPQHHRQSAGAGDAALLLFQAGSFGYASTAAYAKRVRDLLGEYESLSGGKIILEEVDPEPFTDAEDQATAQGLTGAPTDSGDTVYFGLVGTNRIDGKEVIPYFSADREQYLEYDLSSLIYRLSNPKKPQHGIITSLPLQTGPGGMQAMMQGQRPALRRLSGTGAGLHAADDSGRLRGNPKGHRRVDDRAPCGAQRHPSFRRSISSRWAVDACSCSVRSQFGDVAGRRQSYQPSMTSPFSDLPKLFQTWGIGYNPQKILGDRALRSACRSAIRATPWRFIRSALHLTPDNFDDKDPLTANLQAINLASVGALHALKGATTTFLPLMRSSDQASLLDAPEVRMNQRPQDLLTQILPRRVRNS
ncbi:MAG: Gldg family protein [Rhizomicrobium sp.]